MYTVSCFSEKIKDVDLKTIDPLYCKVYMALMSLSEKPFDISDLASSCNIDEHKAESAISFLSDLGLIGIEDPDLDMTAFTRALNDIYDEPFVKDRAFDLIKLADDQGLKSSTMLLIARYTHKIGKDNMQHISVMLKNWQKRGMTDDLQLVRYVSKLERNCHKQEEIKSALGFIRPLNVKEIDFFELWISKDYPVGLIKAAGRICKGKFNEIRLDYVNGILEVWKRQGINTAEDLENKVSLSKSKSKVQDIHYSSFDSELWENMGDGYIPSIDDIDD